MLNRTMIFATALTTAGAMSAYADTVGADLSVKGQTLENAAEVGTEGAASIDKDTYNDDGNQIVTIGTEVKGSNDEGVVDNVSESERDPNSAGTEPENILAAATEGMTVRTVTGDVIGTVAYKQDQGAAGHLVFINTDPAANLQVPTVGIQVKSLQTVKTGDALEYAFSVDYLRDRIADALADS